LASVKQQATIDRKRQEKFNQEHKTINGMDHKFCNKHHIYFPEEDVWFPATLDYFYHNDKNKTDHLHPECKRCGIQKVRERYFKDEAGDIKSKKKAERDLNKIYYKEYHAEWLVDHKDEQKDYQSEWRKDHPEKCRVYSKMHRIHDITESEWRDCLKVFENTCAYCGLHAEKHFMTRNNKEIIMNLHKEHVDDEGYNDLRNAIPSCQHCNSGKNVSDMEEWYRNQKFFSQERLDKIIWWTTEGYKEYIENKTPYRIIRKKNEDNNKFHWELWTVDEMRNMIKCIHRGVKKKDVQEWVDINPVELVT